MLKPFANHSVHELHEFVTNTTIADKKEEVIKFIAYYLIQNHCSIEVENLLKAILTDYKLLEKTIIVNDHRLYETVITIRPTQAYTKKNGKKAEEMLMIYKEKAEILFLCLVSTRSEIQLDEFLERGDKSIESNIEDIFMGKSPYLYAMQEKRKEKEEWKTFFKENQQSILDFFFDLYNKEQQLFNITKDEEFREKGKKIMEIIRICVQQKNP